MQQKLWSLRTEFTWFLFSLTSFSCCQNASRWSSSSSPSAQVPHSRRLGFQAATGEDLEFRNDALLPFLFSVGQPEEQLHNTSCLPNELLLNLLHSSLELELNDREIPLAYSDHGAFMHHILERERDGHVAPFSLPVIKGQPGPIICRRCEDV